MQHRHGPRAPRFVDGPADRALAQHLTMRLVLDRTLTSTDAERRTFVRVMLDVGLGELGLLAFGMADTHVHLLIAATPARAIELARRVKIAMQRRLALGGVSFEPTRVRAVDDVHHLQSVLRYVLGQPARHAHQLDRCFEGSSIHELLGMRVIDGGALLRAVRRMAPRLEPSDLFPLLRVELSSLCSVDYAGLADAAAAAFALGSLLGQSALTVRARRAAVHAAGGLGAGELAALLGVSASLVRAIRQMSVPDGDVESVRLQLRFRAAVKARGE